MTETMPDSAVIREAVRLACRAPSLHNSQPWHWVAEGPALHLFADLTRVMTAADPEGREIYLSCGAALDHLTVAMAASGWHANVHRFPDADNPLHVATVDFHSSAMATTEDVGARASAIGRRRTDRRPFMPPADWPEFETYLRQTVIPYQVMFDVVLDHARPSLANASRLTEAIREYDPSYTAELGWWTSPSDTGDGIPRSALTSAVVAGHVDVGRTFPASKAGNGGEHVDFDRSRIVVLSTHHEDARLDVLRCGEALSSVLLECTAAGLATCTLTHMTELAQSREIVRELTGQRGTPQLLIRIGRAPVADEEPAATPRKPLSEVFEVRPSPGRGAST
ncbi:Acg family FMN-binding oxidoreductase [Mycolicibacterium stellerae]|uniref:Acg family FMN-binding oxidoreductase n=1 Tax=Mycolicibacterium stellerae TaxID=2358193 RepID=UPI000F0BD2BC|nr:NAD(P)H nitroreductase [Mycolicibacterium stellerae]